MGIQTWANVGIVCGAILAAAGVAVLVLKGLHGVWRRDQRLSDLLELVQTVSRQLTATNERLDLTNERLDATNARLDAVELALAWHSPAPTGPVPKPNSGNPPPRRPR